MSGALSLTGPLGLELALGGLMFVVLMLGLFRPASPDRRCGWVSFAGLCGLSAWSFFLQPGGSLYNGAFTLDPLALFAQRLFLVSAAVSVLATLGMAGDRFTRRGSGHGGRHDLHESMFDHGDQVRELCRPDRHDACFDFILRHGDIVEQRL